MAELQESLRPVPPQEIARRSGATFQDGRLHLEMLFQPYEIDVLLEGGSTLSLSGSMSRFCLAEPCPGPRLLVPSLWDCGTRTGGTP